jgi:ribose-phosphate pyrophosphokinase
MKIVAGNSNRSLAQAIASYLNLDLANCAVRRFADGEIFVEIQENVRGEDVFVVQSTSAPTNDHLMELLIITDALRRASARRITAVIPYFGYARQDRKSLARTPISAKLVANMITSAGADRVLTVDLHAGQIQGFFDIPTDNLFAAPVITRDIGKQFEADHLMVVSPDVGGVVRARLIAKRIDAPLAIVDKRRERPGDSEVMNIIGDVEGRHCLLIDDIVDSGGTLCNAAEALLAQGGKSVTAYITHGVLVGRRRPAHHLVQAQGTGDHGHDRADRRCARRQQYSRPLDRGPARRSHQPHRAGKIGLQPVRLSSGQEPERRAGQGRADQERNHADVESQQRDCRGERDESGRPVQRFGVGNRQRERAVNRLADLREQDVQPEPERQVGNNTHHSRRYCRQRAGKRAIPAQVLDEGSAGEDEQEGRDKGDPDGHKAPDNPG